MSMDRRSSGADQPQPPQTNDVTDVESFVLTTRNSAAADTQPDDGERRCTDQFHIDEIPPESSSVLDVQFGKHDPDRFATDAVDFLNDRIDCRGSKGLDSDRRRTLTLRTPDYVIPQYKIQADSDPDLIRRAYQVRLDEFLREPGKDAPPLGPHPDPDQLAYVEEINEAIATIKSGAESEVNAGRQEFEAALASAPEMEFSDRKLWEELDRQLRKVYPLRNEQDYSLKPPVMQYAENWARLMQSNIGEGNQLPPSAIETARDLAKYGRYDNPIDRYQDQIALGVLRQCWQYRDLLEDPGPEQPS